MRLSERVHLVASGSGGFDLTDPFDCHVYLVDGRGETALVDAGIGASAEALLHQVQRSGVPLERIRFLLLTHAHPDHSGGAAALKALLPDLQVFASAQVADVVERGDEEAMSLAAGKRAEFYPRDFRFRPCSVDGRLAEGDQVSIGDLDITVVETPGHRDTCAS